jgi:GDPmannose 4,6-dehydratase
MPRKTALITGVGGQDGSYLAELLLDKGYYVHGLIRHCSVNNKFRIHHLEDHKRFRLHYGDVTQNPISLIKLLEPDEIYNLAAQSLVKESFDIPRYTFDTNTASVIELLEAIKLIDCPLNPKIKLYQASTGEMFGDAPTPHNECTPFHPKSPYAISKLCSYWMVKHYRDAYNIFAVNGILFNHESPRRSGCFLTKKVCRGVADIKDGYSEYITLGNLNAKRDWGHARDYVACMWKMLQQDKPDDFVVCTGKCRTVRELVEEAFKHIDLTITWEGEGLDEIGVDQNGHTRVRVNRFYRRHGDADCLHGDCTKAKNVLDWNPTITFEDMIAEMVNIELLDDED